MVLHCALQGYTATLPKCAGRTSSLAKLGTFNDTTEMDSRSCWFIDYYPLLSCEYSNSYKSQPEINFSLFWNSFKDFFELHHSLCWCKKWLNICGRLHPNKQNPWGVLALNVTICVCQGSCPSITEEEEGWAEQQRGRGGEAEGAWQMGLVSESLTGACKRMLAPSIAQSLRDELLQTNNAE